MKRVMFITSAVSGALMAVFGLLYGIYRLPLFLTLLITSGTVFYHFAMRLCVGYGVDGIFHNKMNYKARWFLPRKWEKRFYEILRVKKWKKHLPTFVPESFDMRSHSAEELVAVTCQSEIVHEIIMVLSLLPILFSVWAGELAVFLITSVLSFLFDSLFVILQRYNRPRLMRLIKYKV